jgi:tetratricopeptide (TPR) repeat protein
MPGVFLSYRRVERDWAAKLARSLGNRFGRDLVFQDVEDIAGGERWRERIRAAIEGAEVVLVSIGPHWLDGDRLDDPGDVLRAELAEALERGKPTIPVLVGGAAMPDQAKLPGALAELTELQAMTLGDDTWNADLALLLERVRTLLAPIRATEPFEDVLREVFEGQARFWALREAGRFADALEAAQRVLAALDRVSPLYPGDVDLQIHRGYEEKNCAIALEDLGRDDDAQRALERSDVVFSTLLEEYPENPSAWDGKGSIVWMRGQMRESLPYFERALELDPDYAAARINRDNVMRALG